jgi:hypothetical protein
LGPLFLLIHWLEVRILVLYTDLKTRLLVRPSLLREEVLAEGPDTVVVDEIQKVPSLLDEVHWCLENTGTKFILCGSSARKLKRGAANLLGGRAWRFELYPLTTREIGDLDLAIEIKAVRQADERHTKGLRALMDDQKVKSALIVASTRRRGACRAASRCSPGGSSAGDCGPAIWGFREMAKRTSERAFIARLFRPGWYATFLACVTTCAFPRKREPISVSCQRARGGSSWMQRLPHSRKSRRRKLEI